MQRRWLLIPLLALACGGQTGTGGGGGAGAVDGGPGGGAAGAGGAQDAGVAPCDALVHEYEQALQAARACAPTSSVLECTAQVPDALDCPCAPTFVNPANATALETLDTLRSAWKTQGCGASIDCPAIDCESPTLGGCEPDPATGAGRCADGFQN